MTKPASWRVHMHDMLIWRSLKGEDVLLTARENEARYLARAYHIPTSQFRTVYNGVEAGRWSLPFSMAALKAMATGLPCIPTELGEDLYHAESIRPRIEGRFTFSHCLHAYEHALVTGEVVNG
jgi:hypothetical protein